MKQTTRKILGVGAIVLLSSGVAGITTYTMLRPEIRPLTYDEMFQQNPNSRLAAYNAIGGQPVDLTAAAETSVHAVVHIKSTQLSKVTTVQQAPIYSISFSVTEQPVASVKCKHSLELAMDRV